MFLRSSLISTSGLYKSQEKCYFRRNFFHIIRAGAVFYFLKPLHKSLRIFMIVITLIPAGSTGQAAEDQAEQETVAASTPSISDRPKKSRSLFSNMLYRETLFAKDTHHRRPAGAQRSFRNLRYRLASYVTTQYVSFGKPFSRGAVWQPSGSIEWKGLGFNIWSNFVINRGPNEGQFNELDLTLYYDIKIDNLTIHPFMLVVFYPNADPGSFDYSDTEDYEPSLHLAYSMDKFHLFMDATLYLVNRPGRFKVKTGLGYRDDITDHLQIETYGLLGIANGRYNKTATTDPGAQINYFEYSLGLVWHPWVDLKGLTIEPNIQFSTTLSNAVKKTTDDPTLIWGGIEVVYRF